MYIYLDSSVNIEKTFSSSSEWNTRQFKGKGYLKPFLLSYTMLSMYIILCILSSNNCCWCLCRPFKKRYLVYVCGLKKDFIVHTKNVMCVKKGTEKHTQQQATIRYLQKCGLKPLRYEFPLNISWHSNSNGSFIMKLKKTSIPMNTIIMAWLYSF